MARFPTSACLVAAVFAVLGVAAQQQPPLFRGESDVVRVFVTVTDDDGRLVTSLQRDDFEVRDEGDPQPITVFDNSPQPVRLVVMVDVSGSMQGNLPLLRASVQQLVARLGSDDLARVGAFGHEVTLNPSFTRDTEELLGGLPERIADNTPTPLWRALDRAMDALADDDAGRPVVLVLSDGKDSGPTGFARATASQSSVIDRARAEDVMVYAIGMRSRGPRQMRPPAVGPAGLRAMILADMPDSGLARVAEDTGGGYAELRGNEDLGAAFARVVDELHSQYLLGFAPSKRDGKVHDIDVRVSGRGLKPRARKDYVAPGSRPSR